MVEVRVNLNTKILAALLLDDSSPVGQSTKWPSLEAVHCKQRNKKLNSEFNSQYWSKADLISSNENDNHCPDVEGNLENLKLIT